MDPGLSIDECFYSQECLVRFPSSGYSQEVWEPRLVSLGVVDSSKDQRWHAFPLACRRWCSHARLMSGPISEFLLKQVGELNGYCSGL